MMQNNIFYFTFPISLPAICIVIDKKERSKYEENGYISGVGVGSQGRLIQGLNGMNVGRTTFEYIFVIKDLFLDFIFEKKVTENVYYRFNIGEQLILNRTNEKNYILYNLEKAYFNNYEYKEHLIAALKYKNKEIVKEYNELKYQKPTKKIKSKVEQLLTINKEIGKAIEILRKWINNEENKKLKLEEWDGDNNELV